MEIFLVFMVLSFSCCKAGAWEVFINRALQEINKLLMDSVDNNKVKLEIIQSNSKGISLHLSIGTDVLFSILHNIPL